MDVLFVEPIECATALVILNQVLAHATTNKHDWPVSFDAGSGVANHWCPATLEPYTDELAIGFRCFSDTLGVGRSAARWFFDKEMLSGFENLDCNRSDVLWSGDGIDHLRVFSVQHFENIRVATLDVVGVSSTL